MYNVLALVLKSLRFEGVSRGRVTGVPFFSEKKAAEKHQIFESHNPPSLANFLTLTLLFKNHGYAPATFVHVMAGHFSKF